MIRYFSSAAAPISFACGLYLARLFGDGPPTHWASRYADVVFSAVTLAACVACYSQCFPAARGPRRSQLYNLLMLGMSGLLFTVGSFLLLLTVVFRFVL